MLMFRAHMCVCICVRSCMCERAQHCYEQEEMSCLVMLFFSFFDNNAKKYSNDLTLFYNPFEAN